MELVIAVLLVIILFVKIGSDKEAKKSACERFDEKQTGILNGSLKTLFRIQKIKRLFL